MESMNKDEKFQRGILHFNAGEFFEAHEVWEEIWLEETEPEKTFLQGIIQIAAAFHHYCRENTDGTETLLAAGIVKLSRFPVDHRGLAIEELRAAAKQWARNIGRGENPKWSEIPRLRFSETHPAIDGPRSKDRR
jgi:predicted metal-dependent hydrolase